MRKQLSKDDMRIGKAAKLLIGWWLHQKFAPQGWHITENTDPLDRYPDFTLRRHKELWLVEVKGKTDYTHETWGGTRIPHLDIENPQLNHYYKHTEDWTVPVGVLFYITARGHISGFRLEHARDAGRGPRNEAGHMDWLRYSTWFVPVELSDVVDDSPILRGKYNEFYRSLHWNGTGWTT